MIRLQLFGRPLLRAPDPLSGPATQRQRLALLALLAVGGDAGVSRDRLIALLWPESDSERGRHLLCNSLYVLRRELGDDAILSRGDTVWLNPACVRSDLRDFLDALERRDCAAAVEHCGEPFLDGFFLSNCDAFERWSQAERDRLAGACSEALERLAENAEGSGDFHAAAGWWQRLVTAEPYSSRAVLRLMCAHAMAGDPAAAIRAARLHEQRLRDDLDAKAPAEVVALARQLCAQGSLLGVPAAESRLPEAPAAAPAAALTASAAPPVTRPGGTRHAQHGTIAAGLAVLPILLVGAVLARRELEGAFARAATRSSEPATVAVLPFAPLTRTPGDSAFCVGVTAELVHELQHLDEVRVERPHLPAAARVHEAPVRPRPGADLLISGDARRAGSDLHISARLSDTRTRYTAWSHTWVVPDSARGVPTQLAIARALAEAVRRELVRR